MSAALRQRRTHAAAALAAHPRRAQLDWADLAAWPEWADDTAALVPMAQRAGALWHGTTLRRCIHGPTLKRVQQTLGAAAFDAALGAESPGPADTPLPAPDHVDAWLHAQGAEVMLAAVPSPLLRLALREVFWPQQLPSLPPPDSARALAVVQQAQRLGAAA